MMRHGDREKEEEGGEFGKGRRAPGHKVNSEEDSVMNRSVLVCMFVCFFFFSRWNAQKGGGADLHCSRDSSV